MNEKATALRKPDRRRYLKILAVITPLLLTALTFSGTLGDAFTNWDDDVYVTANQLVQSLSPQNIGRMFSPSTFVCGNYQPVTILSLAINYALGKLDPRGYIVTNILLHLLNVLLVFIFIRKISKSDFIAWLCALLFGMHPMHVESVAWVTGRKDLLYTFFYLAALVSWLGYRERTGSRRALLYGLVFLLSVLSLLSKSAAVTLPIAFLLLDYSSGRKFSAAPLIEKIPFVIPAIVAGLLAIKGQHSSGSLSAGYTLALSQRVFIGSYSYMFYIVKFFLPVRLSAFYPFPHPITGPLPFSYTIAPFLTLITAGLAYWFRRSKIVLFGFLFFLVNIVFILHFVPVGGTITADRFSYLSYIGLFLIVAALARKALSARVLKNIPIYAAGLIIIAALCFASCRRCAVWKDSLSLWSDAVAFHPSSATCIQYGNALMEVGRNDEALVQFKRAEGINPDNAEAYANLGTAFLQIGRVGEAIANFRKALGLNPHDPQTHNNLGIALFQTGNAEEAIIHFEKAVDLSPGFADAHCNLGNALLNTGRPGGAIVHYRKALELAPDFIAAYKNLSIARQMVEERSVAVK